jgi:3-oxoacyl-[acyl-carrier-protein] synthase II
MDDARIAITGLGAISSAGVGIDENWETLLTGRSTVTGITVFEPGRFPCTIAAQLENFSARNFVPKQHRKSVKIMARDIEIAVAVSDMAFRDSGITTRGTGDEMDIDPKRLGCNIAAGLICADLNELGEAFVTSLTDGKFDMSRWGRSGMENLTPLWLLKYLPNMLSCHVTIIHGAEGPSNCITCGDAAAHMAAGESALYMKRDSVDAAITGSAESKLNPMGLLRQGLLGRVCTNANDRPQTAVRPFDAGHSGLVIGEGGGMLILEKMERARQRGAKIYAEFAGFGAACDSGGIEITEPTAGNLGMSASRAIKNAGIEPDDIDAIFTYGTGVPGEDLAEAEEWRKVFGPRAAEIPAVSFSGVIGSLFAGHGGMQMAIAAKSIAEQIIPPTANHEAPAEGCEMNFAPQPRNADLKNVIAGSFTIGGQSGACVLRKAED